MPGAQRFVITLVATASLAASLVSSPAAADRRDDEREVCQERIADLMARNLKLRQQAAVDKVEIGRLRQRMADLEGRRSTTRMVSGEPSPTDARPAEPVAPIVRQGPAIESSDLDVAPPRTSATRPVPSQPSTTTPAPTSRPGAATDDALQVLYDDGYTLFHRQQYDEAEARFQAFLAESGDSDLADNAHFWVGECRFARGDLQAALEAFTTVVDRYPRGNKVPDAMIKAGKTLEALGDDAAAGSTYREVQSRFPGTAAAASASDLLAALE